MPATTVMIVFAKNASQNKIHHPQWASLYAKKKPVSTDSIIYTIPYVSRVCFS